MNVLDKAVFDFMADHRTPELNRILRQVVRIDGSLLTQLSMGVVLAIWLTYRRAWALLVGVVLSYGLAQLLARSLKAIIDRPRPTGRAGSLYASLGGSAMPSSHALSSAAVLVVVMLMVRWRSGRSRCLAWIASVVFLMVTGLAMAYVSAHWATDMIVGWALGAMVAVAVVPVAKVVAACLFPEPGGQPA